MNSPLSSKEIQDTTLQFYSHFCGTDISKLKHGSYFICSADRDKTLQGYGCKYTLFIFVKEDLCIVSYSPKHRNSVESWKNNCISEIIAAANQQFRLKQMRLLMFQQETVTNYGSARILTESDYPLYEAFFRTTAPAANPDGWLYDYFTEKAEKGYFSGCIKNGRLVSVCDAPDMPYMDDVIQHTGINTLEEERQKGYAKCAAALSIHHLLENGICPQWECNINNTASLALAKSIGYSEFGLAYILAEY